MQLFAQYEIAERKNLPVILSECFHAKQFNAENKLIYVNVHKGFYKVEISTI